jgi:hypothetical protein
MLLKIYKFIKILKKYVSILLMKKKLESTQNSLSDVIKWLTDGFIICIYSSYEKINTSLNTGLYFYSRETLDKLNDESIIYINISSDSSLLCEDEWPWYIKNAGFVEYKSFDILPSDSDHIYNFYLKF